MGFRCQTYGVHPPIEQVTRNRGGAALLRVISEGN